MKIKYGNEGNLENIENLRKDKAIKEGKGIWGNLKDKQIKDFLAKKIKEV